MKTALIQVVLTVVLIACSSLFAQTAGSGWEPEPGWTQSRFLRSDIDLLGRARKQEADGNLKDAADTYAALAKRSQKPVNKALAFLHEANCRLRAGKFAKARPLYEKLVSQYPGYASLAETTGRLREIAEMYASGEARFWSDGREDAIEIYELILKAAPAGANAPTDLLRLAELQEELRRYDAALTSYRQIQQRFPQTDAAVEAQLRSAETTLAKAQAGRLDQGLAEQANVAAVRFIERHPNQPDTVQARQVNRQAEDRLAGYLLYLAEFYTRPAHYRPEAAERYLQQLLALYAESAAADDARIMLARLQGRDAGPGPRPITDIRRAITEARELPDMPPDIAAEAEPPPYLQGAALIEEKERVTKWLLPITDLGLDKEN